MENRIQELLSRLQLDGYFVTGLYTMGWRRWHDLENDKSSFYCEGCKCEIMDDDLISGFKPPFYHYECDLNTISSLSWH